MEKSDELSGRTYNLGSERGHTVLEVMDATRRVTGVDLQAQPAPRRKGDPASLVANPGLAQQELDWMPEFHEIERIIDSAWRWLRAYPLGYDSADRDVLEATPSARK
jgi:UDP-glucose 4-epimerase